MSESLNDAHLESQLPQAVVELIRRAAAIQGRSLSDFVVSSAREAAEQAIAQHELLSLSLEDQQRFADSLGSRPLPPNLKQAAKQHGDLVEPT